ncbi:formin-like protein 6 isoform X2 [Sitophilus oryzae]|uniref:Regulation of nuclear pre-mRNA domain-containing protein 2 n=1 Tax=Sitophilus oryzae TaxID=7048 RepID=A0A6J2YGQ2_SITOR|nr:formin-like protein 6 isoform X2 [Sitophilus oryzae]
MGTSAPAVEVEFNAFQFEKLLTNLKDSQDSINHCCQWCLQNRQHHKKIVNSWLNVVKRVKIEQRLVLFYLANDVVQYSKRRNYAYVESWGTAIQKATTLVRDEKVKHKILRIFKIWEQRGVYGEDFIADLSGLISVQPTGPKNDEPHEFQASYVINKIKNCANLEKDTDLKLKHLNEHNPKIQISEGLTNSLKDRVHVDDVEKELDVYVQHMEDYINALKLEIKNRIALISVLKQAETQLEADRKDVKLVAHAYKTFGQRVKVFQKKLEEHMEDLPSPVPSPDINAPSPSPDSDLELPDDPAENKSTVADTSVDLSATIQFTNPGYYNPVAPHLDTSTNSLANTTATAGTNESNLSFLSNGFTSFLGQNLSFDITNISASGLFTSSVNNSSALNNSQTSNSYANTSTDLIQPPVPIDSKASENDLSAVYNPLLPPPMPPFSKNNDDGGFSFNSSMEGTNTFDSIVSIGVKDVDHRNLISLTGSPNDDADHVNGVNPPPPVADRSNLTTIIPQETLWENHDQDYRTLSTLNSDVGPPPPPPSSNSKDQDYRLQFGLDNLTIPPPPPPPKSPEPPPKAPLAPPPLPLPVLAAAPPPPPPPKEGKSPGRRSDNNEGDIDMDLSDDLEVSAKPEGNGHASLEPPPPLPDLLDDVDANQFLDDISND